MSLNTLSEFIDAIDAAGELARVSFPVAAKLELCEIADRVMKRPGGGRALLFENVKATIRGPPGGRRCARRI